MDPSGPYSVDVEPVSDTCNGNADVVVRDASGERYWATFFTPSNVQTLMSRYQSTGECLSGSYFWAANMIVIEEISEPLIHQVIEDLFANGCFKTVFAILED